MAPGVTPLCPPPAGPGVALQVQVAAGFEEGHCRQDPGIVGKAQPVTRASQPADVYGAPDRSGPPHRTLGPLGHLPICCHMLPALEALSQVRSPLPLIIRKEMVQSLGSRGPSRLGSSRVPITLSCSLASSGTDSMYGPREGQPSSKTKTHL